MIGEKKKMYYLLDLERTIANRIPFYWKTNKRGYTTSIEFAGLYDEKEAAKIVESDFDKFTVMISQQKIHEILGMITIL